MDKILLLIFAISAISLQYADSQLFPIKVPSLRPPSLRPPNLQVPSIVPSIPTGLPVVPNLNVPTSISDATNMVKDVTGKLASPVLKIAQNIFIRLFKFPFMDIAADMWKKVIPLPPPGVFDLSEILELGKNDQFSPFDRRHQQLAAKLIRILQGEGSFLQFLANSLFIRHRINVQLFNYAMTVLAGQREETRNLTLPSNAEIFPYKFINRQTLAQVQREAKSNPQAQVCVEQLLTGQSGKESAVAYFREDIGVNLHHWYWHLIYPFNPQDNGTAVVLGAHKNRQGELFYYMHAQIIARYFFERLSNGLEMVEPFDDFTKRMDEFNSGVDWAPGVPYADRKQDTTMKNFIDFGGQRRTIQELYGYRDRLQESIRSNSIIFEDGQERKIPEEEYINYLGKMVEASTDSPNLPLYGDLHNLIHSGIALSHNPRARQNVSRGVMGDTATAMRDPIFYSVHLLVDNLLREHKDSLPPYTRKQLGFDGIKISNVAVKSNEATNEFVTFWEGSYIDVSDGLTFEPKSPVTVCYKHLQHSPFTFDIEVDNKSKRPKMGTVRIFLAPAIEMPFDSKHRYFIELDKFVYDFKTGKNRISRHSSKSSVTTPPDNTFQENLKDQKAGASKLKKFIYNGCGWPNYFMIPKGTEEGLAAELFVMVSDYENGDKPKGQRSDLNAFPEASGLCGVRDKIYPDGRAMGFPFDRRAEESSISDYLLDNMFLLNTQIRFVDETRN